MTSPDWRRHWRSTRPQLLRDGWKNNWTHSRLTSIPCRMNVNLPRRCRPSSSSSSERSMYASDRRTGLSYPTGLTCSTGLSLYCTRLQPPFCSIPHSWLSLRYPIPVSTRARLARLFYELALLPGIEPRLIRSWIDDLSRLLANKGDVPRKVEPADLQLPWKPLWRVLQKELWPKKRAYESSYVYGITKRFAAFSNYFVGEIQ